MAYPKENLNFCSQQSEDRFEFNESVKKSDLPVDKPFH